MRCDRCKRDINGDFTRLEFFKGAPSMRQISRILCQDCIDALTEWIDGKQTKKNVK